MTKVISVVGSSSNVGKTTLIENLIKELKSRGHNIGTIKHSCHGFDIDKKGKDTYRHSEAGATTVVLSSKNKLAIIKEVEEELSLDKIIEMMKDKDIILVEGYKKSNLRKIEVFRCDTCSKIISHKDLLIAVAIDIELQIEDVAVLRQDDYKSLADLIEKEEDYKGEY